jgi:hypothetical protein
MMNRKTGQDPDLRDTARDRVVASWTDGRQGVAAVEA